jgi:hypothetical protein
MLWGARDVALKTVSRFCRTTIEMKITARTAITHAKAAGLFISEVLFIKDDAGKR